MTAQGRVFMRVYDAQRLKTALRAVAPPLLFGFRLWASVCLALYVAFWLELDNAFWAGYTAVTVSQPRLGASLRKGWFRMVGTVVGAAAVVALTACFPQDRGPFLIGLALWEGRLHSSRDTSEKFCCLRGRTGRLYGRDNCQRRAWRDRRAGWRRLHARNHPRQ
jgi:hypothetical protein